ncbi:efflux RND transporter periplasmic adaptor subunit [Aliarcobacter thereius]|uniref:Efflux RND transporter periplasmic adaptor subunit n=1 Tax=Aliarcobacter thereius TaxID=544718 RepID=A0A5R9H2N0_9BACT|nr:efflux RND transporter periplasmic adaptor subunit [Aliarcobacter thereius]TLS71550.1 efflux RND transporter periplasmic adaptor subunit [Aliarcobacter thereius]
MNDSLLKDLNSYKGGKKSYKYWVLLILVIFIALMVYIFLPQNEDLKPRYNTQKAQIGDLKVIVSASGNLSPTNSVEIGIEVSGTIKEIFVDYNDEVTIGQVLAKIDTTKLEASVESSKASLAISKANLNESEVNLKNKKLIFDRTKKMFESSGGKFPSQNEYDDTLFAYEVALASVKASKAKVLQSESDLKNNLQNLDKASVKSSINGIVLNREVEVGQTLAATMSAPKLFTLAKDLSNMDLIVNIDEADVADIKDGLDVLFTVDAYANKEFKGKIKQVRLNPITTNGVVTYETVVSVTNDDLLLKPGMTANAKIVTKNLENQLLVPNSAFRFKPIVQVDKKAPNLGSPSRFRPSSKSESSKSNDGMMSLYILENNEPKEIKVKIISSNTQQTAVSSKSLKQDDEIITSMKSKNAK